MRPHAYSSAFTAGGLWDVTGAWLGLAGHARGLVGWTMSLVSPSGGAAGAAHGKAGLGLSCSGAVAVLVTRSQQAAERRTPGNQHSWRSSPRGMALGATAGRFRAHARGCTHAIRVGERALGLVVRRGTMSGSTWAAQCGSEDGSTPSVWRQGSPVVGWGSGAGMLREGVPGEMLFAQSRASPSEVGTQGQG